MASVRVQVNRLLLRELRRSPQFRPLLKERTEAIARVARDLASREAYDTGAYRDSIHAEVGDHPRTGNLVGRVNAEDFKAHWIEFGFTRKDGTFVKGRGILRRAARRSGLRLRRRKKRS